MKLHLVFSVVVFLLACQQQKPPAAGELAKNLQAGKPQLVKIAVRDSAQVNELRRKGYDIVVVQPDYVVAKIDLQQSRALAEASLSMEPVRESDMVQRLVRIAVHNKDEVQKLADMGLDLWQVREDSVFARAYDKYIFELQQKGFHFDILKQNAADVAARR